MEFKRDSVIALYLVGELQDATHIKKLAWTKVIAVPNSARAHRWTKKLDWKEPKSYYACTKVASYRIWFPPMRSHSKEVSLKFTTPISRQNSSAADGNGVDHRNGRWSLPARIHRA